LQHFTQCRIVLDDEDSASPLRHLRFRPFSALQTLTLLHGVLHSRLKDEKAAELARRAQETLDSMSGMLDALLDINQLEAGQYNRVWSIFRSKSSSISSRLNLPITLLSAAWTGA
jgi:hypothetical protein